MLLVASATWAVACSSFERNLDEASLRSSHAAITEGEQDSDTTAVFALQARFASTSRRCTAFLVAPNLFLTARHCLVASDSQLTCDTPFPELVSPSSLDFTNPTRIDSEEAELTPIHHGSRIFVPSGSPLCGDDLALVTTDALLETPPLALHLDAPPEASDEYAAVGYGLLGELIGGEGTRRRREGLRFECDTAGCAPTLTDGEILGESAPCEGDSGGPALDAEGRAIAVLSRGTASCETPIYETLFAHREWLREVATDEAEAAGYAPPEWATVPPPPLVSGPGGSPASEPSAGGEGGTAPPSHGVAGATVAVERSSEDEDGSCSWTAASRSSGSASAVFGTLVVAALAMRRLRHHVASSRTKTS